MCGLVQEVRLQGELRLKFDFGSLITLKRPPLVGVDISTSVVRLVELSSNDRGEMTLESCASEPLPRGAIVDGNIENIEMVSEALRRVWRRSGTKIKAIALGMPSTSVITRKVVLSANLSEDDMEYQVESEASQYIPFALDEVSLDFDVIGPAQNSPDEVEVMVAAARREKVDDRVAAAEAAGLNPVVMDIESYAARTALMHLMAQLPQEESAQIIALLQIGSQTATFSVLVDGDVVYEREQAFGGNQLTQDISRAFGLSFEEAEQRKKTGDLPKEYKQEVLQPFFESVVQETTRAIQFFFTSSPYTRVDHIVLAGGCASLPGVDDIVASRTRVKTTVARPFMGVHISSKIRERSIQQEEQAYLVAYGLAMRRFD